MDQAEHPLYWGLKKINSVSASISGLILLFITLSIFVDVFLRYFLNRPSIWITEVSSYLFLYVIFFGTAYALQENLHIRVTFLTDRFNPLLSFWIELLTLLVSTVFCIVLLWQASVMTWAAFNESWTTPTMLGVQNYLIYLSIVFGSFMLLLTFLMKIGLLLTNRS